ncbi:hypothetical protein N1037_03330 [Phaeobacter sp. G2]|nr:hypothetical protein N1037_03330 [Phaeobacter sp. G2]
MRHTKNKIWHDRDRFFVPHLFCASFADNIVKPDHAIDGTLDNPFVTHDDFYKHLGHSHLSKAPNKDLVEAICNKSREFLSSGYSFPGIDIQTKLKKRDSFVLQFSRSEQKISKLCRSGGRRRAAPSLAGQQVESVALRCPTHIAKEKKLSAGEGGVKIEVIDLDNYFSIGVNDVVDLVCEEAAADYGEILFDPFDFQKSVLLKNEDFCSLFMEELRLNGQNLCRQIQDSTIKLTYQCYDSAVHKFWNITIHRLYADLTDVRKPKPTRFRQVVEKVCRHFGSTPYHTHKEIYARFKMEFSQFHWVPEVRSVDVLISHLFRTDGELYGLDRDISSMLARV